MASYLDSDLEFTGFSVEDLRFLDENYARVAKEQIVDISDLDLTDLSDDEYENEDSELYDPFHVHRGDIGQWCNRLNEIEINEYVGNVGPALVLSELEKETDFFSQIFLPKVFDFIANETKKIEINFKSKGTSGWQLASNKCSGDEGLHVHLVSYSDGHNCCPRPIDVFFDR